MLVDLTEDNWSTTVQSDGIVLVDFWAPWCGPCRLFGPIFEAAAGRHPDIVFGKVNTEEQPQLAAAYGISAIPTLMAIRDGIVVFAQAGALPEAALEQLIAQVRALDMDEVRRRMAAQPAQG